MSDRSTQTVLSEAPKDVGAEVSALPAVDVATPATIITATLSEGTGWKRGPVPKRRLPSRPGESHPEPLTEFRT